MRKQGRTTPLSESNNPTCNTTSWQERATQGSLYSSGRGKTQTEAFWAQDVWTINPFWQVTIGGREEHWQASGGYNFSGTTGVVQPNESADAFSPKATVRWRPGDDWTVTGSAARAVRFPTVGELYQLVSTGSTYSTPDPDLSPERDLSGEIAIERSVPGGSTRLSVFRENTHDALISQTADLAAYPVPVTYVVNVGEIRNRGLELAAQQSDVLVHGFDLEGSVTFVDSTILSNDEFASATGTTSAGKHAPYVPRWRATLVATYRPSSRWALTVAGRYSGQMYSTVDNSDTTSHVFGAFDSFLVFDARVHYDVTEHLSAALGVDNFTNREYFLFHPFPQRTIVADLHLKL
jgi:iron complex outermembrane recepter protein